MVGKVEVCLHCFYGVPMKGGVSVLTSWKLLSRCASPRLGVAWTYESFNPRLLVTATLQLAGDSSVLNMQTRAFCKHTEL